MVLLGKVLLGKPQRCRGAKRDCKHKDQDKEAKA